MLDTLRKSTGSWVIKILFGLLIVSFGIWGIGDVVRGVGGGGPAIEVGAIAYDARAVTQEFSRDVARLRQVLGNELTNEEAQRMGLMNQTIQRIVSRATLEMGARSMGVSAPDEVVRSAVTRTKEFQDGRGQFDRNRFLQLVSANGYTEESFLHRLRSDIVRSHMLEPVSLGAAPPKVLVEAIYRHRNEKRVAETLTVATSSLPAPPAPTPAELAAFHKEHAASFTSPEYRTVTALILNESTVAGDVRISDEALATAYEQHMDEFHTPERRRVEQALFETREQADAALMLIRQGRALADAARQVAGTSIEVVSLDWVAKSEIVPAELGGAVFALPVDVVSDPLKSPFGWHLFRVTGSEPESTKPLAEVRARLEKDLIAEKSLDALYNVSGKVEDSLSAGASIEDAARKFNLKPEKFPEMDRSGLGRDGKPVAGLPRPKEFLASVFSAEQGKESAMVETDGGYFVLRVDSVAPSEVQPLDRVHAKVVEQWTAARRDEAARKKAKDLLDRLKAGGDPRGLAASGAAFALTKPLPRTGDTGANLPPSLLGDLFAHHPGDVVMAATEGGYVVARLKEIVPADPAADPLALSRISEELKSGIGADLASEFTAAIGRKFDIKVNRRALEER
ncbi:MAG: peptidyl-prolyl cis-trans isomerase [Alphaproteobacteria bacterium]|nr:peptidyl-prolyl cis-trans isomerase [Alphaproteobacteria bacterium]